jgi:hypothetical protein
MIRSRQLSARQTLSEHSLLAQSVFCLQRLPSPHGAHDAPPQSTSVSSPSRVPLVQWLALPASALVVLPPVAIPSLPPAPLVRPPVLCLPPMPSLLEPPRPFLEPPFPSFLEPPVAVSPTPLRPPSPAPLAPAVPVVVPGSDCGELPPVESAGVPFVEDPPASEVVLPVPPPAPVDVSGAPLDPVVSAPGGNEAVGSFAPHAERVISAATERQDHRKFSPSVHERCAKNRNMSGSTPKARR